MASEILTKTGTIIVLADTTDHAPGATAKNNLGTRTDQIDLTSLADTEYRQSAKFDFGGGTAKWAGQWEVTVAIEPTSAPSAAKMCNLWIGFSQSATAAQDNPANLSGADSAYTGYGAADTDADEAVNQLRFLSGIASTADAAIFVANIATISVPMRYGIILVQNKFGVALAGDAIEMSIRLSPVIPEGQ